MICSLAIVLVILDVFIQEMQDFSDDNINLLQESDLTNDNNRTICIHAATLLTQALSVKMQPGEFSLFVEHLNIG